MNSEAIELAWEQTIRQALLGTSRSGEIHALSSSGIALAEAEAETILLRNAAILTQIRRVGPMLETVAIDPVDPSPLETRPAVGEAAEVRFGTMHKGSYSELISEWLAHVAKLGKQLPFRLIPELLELGKTRKELRNGLVQVIGARGYWLVAQNSDWQYVWEEDLDVVHDAPKYHLPSGVDLDRAWQVRESWERIRILRVLRRQKSSEALRLTELAWRDVSVRERIALLDLLRPDLTSDDEPFLESALDDRSKDVRETAAKMLAILPGSALSKRMMSRLQRMVKVSKSLLGRIKIEIEPPTVCDRGMQRDGIEIKPPPSTGLGERAWWFQQIVGLTSPKAWEVGLGFPLTPELVLAVTESSDWYKPLATGLFESSVLYSDQNWIIAIVTLESAHFLTSRHQFANVLTPVQRNIYFEKALKNLSNNDKLAIERILALAQVEPFNWSMNLARTVLTHLSRITSDPESAKQHYLWAQLFRMASTSFPVELLNDVRRTWPDNAIYSPVWQSPIDKLLDTLKFRVDMIQEIAQQ